MPAPGASDPDSAAYHLRVKAPGSNPSRRRVPWIAAAGLAFALAATAPLTWDQGAGRDPSAPPTTSPPTADGSAARAPSVPGPQLPATSLPRQAAEQDLALGALLDQRARAVLNADAPGILRTVSTRSVDDLEQQRILAANLTDLPLKRWEYALGASPVDDPDLVRSLQRRVGADAVVRTVDLTYQLDGFDIRPVESERVMAFVDEPDGWRIAADVDTGTFLAPWDVAPLNVVRGRSVLVLSASSVVSTSQLTRLGDAAVREVTAIWGSAWDRKVVVVVPASQRQLGQLLRRDEANYDQLAAVATSERSGDSFLGAAHRVWVNPGTWGKVNPKGRAIVLRHEITHVATGAAVPGDFPIWLEEGFADYVGYRPSGVDRSIIARDLLAQARQGKVPTALPDRQDFAGASPTLSTAYEGAWWACQYLVDTYGEDALLEIYRAALADPDQAGSADRALKAVVGISEAQLTQAWRASLKAAA